MPQMIKFGVYDLDRSLLLFRQYHRERYPDTPQDILQVVEHMWLSKAMERIFLVSCHPPVEINASYFNISMRLDPGILTAAYTEHLDPIITSEIPFTNVREYYGYQIDRLNIRISGNSLTIGAVY